MAKKWSDGLKLGAQQQAMGLVTEKKQAITQGPSTSANSGSSVIEVENQDELIRKSLEAQMAGQKDVRYIIKGARR